MIVFVDVLGLGITLPVLPLYAQDVFGATATQITLLASVYFAAQFLASPRLGRLSDRVGRRPVLILSQAGTFLALLLSGAAFTLPLLYVARIIDGLTGGNISVAQAYLADITDVRNRARGLGLVSAAFGAGFIFGPAFGALVAAHFGPRAPFFMAAAVSALTVTLTWRLLPESLTPERRAALAAASTAGTNASRRQALVRTPGVLAIFLIGFLAQLSFFSFQSTYVLWTEAVLYPNRDPQFVQTAVGGSLTFVGVVGIITQFWLVGPLVARFGERALVAAGTIMRGAAWGLMAALPVAGVMLPALLLMAVGGHVAVPALIALLTYLVPSDQRGYSIGMMESVQGVGRIAGPLAAGWLFEHVGPNAPLWLAALASAATLAAAAALWRTRPQAQEVGQAVEREA
jgi:DHA1 family tetracycline resistance protein-like MFS transporter